ncbi:MAG TPA: fatty acid desaturase [Verrucomicrobiales bacterium]|nr:fatty acid desaturase [Verrucomicrobiales bacterium]
MRYRPLNEARKSLRVEWYRCPISLDKLRELSQRSDLQGWFQAGGHLALFASTGGFAYFLWSREIWLGFMVILFAHGTVASFFAGIAPHELGHGTVFRTRWLNRVFKYIFSLISWFDPFDYAVSHTYHHRYTLHPEGDREVLLPLHPSVGATFLLQMFTVNLFTQRSRTFGRGGLIPTIIATTQASLGRTGSQEIPSQEWLATLHKNQPEEHRKSIRFSRLTLLFHGSVAGLSIVSGVWVLPLLVTVPSFIGNWLAYFVGLTQHCGLRDNVQDFRKCTRSIKLDPLSEFLYWRMNWHTEHHMYAGVPCYHLKKLSRVIADDMPKPLTLMEAWRDMRETWKKQNIEPGYQFDTPLPEMAGRIPANNSTELEKSIGELAPDQLK